MVFGSPEGARGRQKAQKTTPKPGPDKKNAKIRPESSKNDPKVRQGAAKMPSSVREEHATNEETVRKFSGEPLPPLKAMRQHGPASSAWPCVSKAPSKAMRQHGPASAKPHGRLETPSVRHGGGHIRHPNEIFCI